MLLFCIELFKKLKLCLAPASLWNTKILETFSIWDRHSRKASAFIHLSGGPQESLQRKKTLEDLPYLQELQSMLAGSYCSVFQTHGQNQRSLILTGSPLTSKFHSLFTIHFLLDQGPALDKPLLSLRRECLWLDCCRSLS